MAPTLLSWPAMRAWLGLTFLFVLGCNSSGLGPTTNNDLGDHLGNDLSTTTTNNDLGDHLDCSDYTDQQSCLSHGCVPFDCGCGVDDFASCFAPGTELPECDPPPCPPPSCAAHATQASCDADPACYSLLTQALCNCAGSNCCPEVFMTCEDGPVQCEPTGSPANCALSESCTGATLPAYEGGCQLGCVEAALCGV